MKIWINKTGISTVIHLHVYDIPVSSFQNVLVYTLVNNVSVFLLTLLTLATNVKIPIISR